MYFPKVVLSSLLLALAPKYASGFTTPTTTFISKGIVVASQNALAKPTHSAGCPCDDCVKPCAITNSCNCLNCASKTTLRMSDVTEDIPAEITTLDGVESAEEAHNTERPARGSGIQKHKKNSKSGTPLGDLEVGSTVEGKVKTITSYGAFVDIGAETDALLHVSRLSSNFVSKVEDVVKAGDSVSVRIVIVDEDKKQIAISMLTEEEEASVTAARENRSSGGKRKARPQRSQGDRQAQVAVLQALGEKGFDSNKFVEGEVVNTLDFGAFVRFDTSQIAEGLEGELDGLVHISSLCVGRASSVDSVVSSGDKVQVRVKSVDTQGNKVSLSMITPEEEQASRPPRNEGGRRNRMFNEDEMGAKDWKESLEKFQEAQPAFSNMPVVVDKRK